MATETKTFYPGEYDTSDYSYNAIGSPEAPVGKGSSNTSYATIRFKTGAGAETYTYWPFDLSAIPGGATIDSVTCKIKVYIARGSSSYVVSNVAQLYSGDTAKGNAYTLGNTETVATLTTGTWTREELARCRLRLYAKRGNSDTSATMYIFFYGADLTITYTYQTEKFMLKLGGVYNDVARVFKKVNGIWVEQESLEGVVDTSKKLVNGGEIN